MHAQQFARIRGANAFTPGKEETVSTHGHPTSNFLPCCTATHRAAARAHMRLAQQPSALHRFALIRLKAFISTETKNIPMITSHCPAKDPNPGMQMSSMLRIQNMALLCKQLHLPVVFKVIKLGNRVSCVGLHLHSLSFPVWTPTAAANALDLLNIHRHVRWKTYERIQGMAWYWTLPSGTGFGPSALLYTFSRTMLSSGMKNTALAPTCRCSEDFC